MLVLSGLITRAGTPYTSGRFERSTGFALAATLAWATGGTGVIFTSRELRGHIRTDIKYL